MEENTTPTTIIESDTPDFLTALSAFRRRKVKLNKAKREAEEIKFLNIVAMMDMLTILLVFMLKGVSFSNDAVAGGDALVLPHSTIKESPMEAVKVLITKSQIMVEDKVVAQIKSGLVTDEFVSKTNNYKVDALVAALNESIDQQLSLGVGVGRDLDFKSDLVIFADSFTPFTTIFQVMYSAGQAGGSNPTKKVGFNKYRLVTLKNAD